MKEQITAFGRVLLSPVRRRDIRRIFVGLSILTVLGLAGCPAPTSSGPGNNGPTFNAPGARSAATSAYVQALQGAAGTSGTYSTYTYASPSGGTATLEVLQGTGNLSSPLAPASLGYLVFASYVDAASGYVLNGSLNYVYFHTASTAPYTEYADFSGSVSYTGNGTSGSVVFDFLAATSVDASSVRSAPTLSGTLSVSGYYDVSTGSSTSAPTPTVSFSPLSGSGLGPTNVTLSAPGADTIYYTTDGTVPTTSSNVYTVPFSENGAAIMAYAVKAGVPGRVSIVVYPLGA
jgi:hypothetical protein